MQETRDARIADSSRAQYFRSSVKLIQWLFRNKRSLLGDEFLAGIDPSLTDIPFEYIKAVLGPPVDLNRPPIKFEQFDPSDFMLWIHTLRKDDNSTPGISALNGHRSAFFNLFKDFRQIMSREMEVEFQSLFRGLKQQKTIDKADGTIILTL